jgi:hypothetical protein
MRRDHDATRGRRHRIFSIVIAAFFMTASVGLAFGSDGGSTDPTDTRTIRVATATPSSEIDTNEVTPIDVMLAYQRVGRSLILLQRKRGPLVTHDMRAQFRTIHLREAILTPDACRDAAIELKELRLRIERNQGVDVSTACLRNPLARGCK